VLLLYSPAFCRSVLTALAHLIVYRCGRLPIAGVSGVEKPQRR
jgi:hypothetical protein